MSMGGGKPYIYTNPRRTDETFIYLGCFNICWGHAITDNLSRLWFLRTEECRKLLDEGARVVYVPGMNVSLPEWHKEVFRLAGVNPDLLYPITEPVLCKRVVVPDRSLFVVDGYLRYTEEFRNVINIIINNVDSDGRRTDKIFFTRSAVKDSREWGNEKEIDNLFKSQGYEVISPENFSVMEQIRLLKGCREFAAPEGSCSHNAIFCSPGTKVTVLRKACYVNKYTIAIGYMTGVKTVYVDANATIIVHPRSPMIGPFYTCVTSCLCRCLGVSTSYSPYYMKKSYWEYFCWLVRFVIFAIWRKTIGRIISRIKVM